MSDDPATPAPAPRPICFVAMPISDPSPYEAGHFKRVYEGLFRPAIKLAGFEADRADDTASSKVILRHVLKQLLTAPMVLCDLSHKNANVFFELGIRQAFAEK